MLSFAEHIDSTSMIESGLCKKECDSSIVIVDAQTSSCPIRSMQSAYFVSVCSTLRLFVVVRCRPIKSIRSEGDPSSIRCRDRCIVHYAMISFVEKIESLFYIPCTEYRGRRERADSPSNYIDQRQSMRTKHEVEVQSVQHEYISMQNPKKSKTLSC